MAGRLEFDVADPALAPLGGERIEWAARRMPVLASVRARLETERPFDGIRIGASLHITPETGVLLDALAAGGAELVACASNPLSTNDEVAAALVERGIAVHARHGEGRPTYERHVDAVLDRGPQLIVDDGCDLAARLHATRSDALGPVIGGTEDTSTGALRLRALAGAGGLRYPVLALSSASVRRLFDNVHGTGQSTVDGIVRATNVLLAGATVVVAGYGDCGRGVASRARGLGAIVVVTEVDPRRALEAATDGFRVVEMAEAARLGEVFVTATGARDVLRPEHFAVMRDGAILANAGQFDVEIDVPGLAASAQRHRRVRPMVDEYVLAPTGRRLLLLAEGRLVNLGAADGHPPQVMDISFAVQALACEWLVQHAAELEPVVHDLPEAIDEAVARLKLSSLGVHIDELTAEQRAYLADWA